MKMRLNIPRVIASLLALGACFWGILLSPVIAQTIEKPMVLLTLGPGYVVTLGYLILVFVPPALPARLLIWGLSVLVQGAWLVWYGIDLVRHLAQGGSWNEPPLFLGWWLFATVGSIVGLLLEKESGEKGSN